MPATGLSFPDLKSVKIGERRLHYLVQGKGQSVVFVHSSLTDYRSWPFQMESFSKKYHVISYSRRFAYPNEKVGNDVSDNSIEDNAADLAELIQNLAIAPVNLIGHSSGAFIALFCAYQNPKLVKALVLGEPSIFQLLANSSLEDDVQLFQSYEENGAYPAYQALSRGDDEKAVRIVLDAAFGMLNVFDHIPEPTRKLLMDNVMGLRGELESELTLSFTAQNAAQIRTPTLFVKGEHSPRLFQRIIDILSEHMLTTDQVTIPGVSHDLGRSTKPDIFTARLMEFLAKNS